MGIQVTFDIKGNDEPVVVNDATAPAPNTRIELNGDRYDVLSVTYAYWSEGAGVQQATVRLRAVNDEFVAPQRLR